MFGHVCDDEAYVLDKPRCMPSGDRSCVSYGMWYRAASSLDTASPGMTTIARRDRRDRRRSCEYVTPSMNRTLRLMPADWWVVGGVGGGWRVAGGGRRGDGVRVCQ